MPELRKDPITGRWIVVNVEKPYAPADYDYERLVPKSEAGCPFCPGNEDLASIEIEATSDAPRQPNTPGWKVRVVANKYPALRIEGDLDKRAFGLYDRSNGIGAHEVIVDSPHHFKDIPELTGDEVADMLRIYRSRSLDLRQDKRFKYLLIFKNVGPAAGASLGHGHSQLIALPMVPKNVKEEVKGAQEYYRHRERCIFCDMLAYEEDCDMSRVVAADEHFMAFCPLSGRFSFEVWVVPRLHSGDFGELTDAQIPGLALILRQALARLKKVLGPHSYNYILHTLPVNSDSSPAYHWHIEIMPKLSRVAGFEWGSGFYVVQTPPEVAARYLKDARLDE